MTKNPVLNALGASAYIVFIVEVMSLVTRTIPKPANDTILAPIAILSIFTLSAATMGYIFCYTPGRLYFEGHKKEAVQLFLKTVGSFAVITAIYLIIAVSGIIR